MNRLIMVFALLLLISCRKNKSDKALYTLPAITETGANTFGFKLNGVVWTTNGKECRLFNCKDNPLAAFHSHTGGTLSYTNGNFNISADRIIYHNNSTDPSESIFLSLNKIADHTGIYKLKEISGTSQFLFTDNLTGSTYALRPDRETVTLNITRLDTLDRIISGQFSGTLFKQGNLNDSATLTDGRFDLQVKWQ